MKKRLLTVAALSVSCLFALNNASAQSQANTFYGKLDIGGSWMNDTTVTELFGPVIGDDEVKFDPGLRLGMAAGYNVTDWFAGEFELGMSWNEIDKLGLANPFEASLFTMPFLVNVKLQMPENATIMRPYIGAGAGGASSVVDIDHLYYAPSNISLYGSASDVTFAWQGFAGVKFEINEMMSIGVEYRYVWVTAPEFDIDWGYYYNIDSGEMAFDDMEIHSASLVFNMRF